MNKDPARVVQRFMRSLHENRRSCENIFRNPERYTREQILWCIRFNLKHYKSRSIMFAFFPRALKAFKGKVGRASQFVYHSLKRLSKEELVGIIEQIFEETESHNLSYCEECYGENFEYTMALQDGIAAETFYDNHNDYYHDIDGMSMYDRDYAGYLGTHYMNQYFPEDISRRIIGYL